jgi:hypothetical protein
MVNIEIQKKLKSFFYIFHSTANKQSEETNGMAQQSIIFVNGDCSTYNNIYTEGATQMIWRGQRKGGRDNRVTAGTRVWYRQRNNRTAFTFIGTVERVEMLTPGNRCASIPATYRLYMILEENPRTIEKAIGDTTTHQSILRAEGFSEEVVISAKIPHGIY